MFVRLVFNQLADDVPRSALHTRGGHRRGQRLLPPLPPLLTTAPLPRLSVPLRWRGGRCRLLPGRDVLLDARWLVDGCRRRGVDGMTCAAGQRQRPRRTSAKGWHLVSEAGAVVFLCRVFVQRQRVADNKVTIRVRPTPGVVAEAPEAIVVTACPAAVVRGLACACVPDFPGSFCS